MGLAGRAELYVLDGVLGDEADAFASAGARPVLNSLEQIARWGGRGAALLHIDTGMARLGLSSAEVERLARDSALLAGVHIELVLTHLACADEPDHALNPRSSSVSSALRRRLPTAPTSIGNSAAIFLRAASIAATLCGPASRYTAATRSLWTFRIPCSPS